MNFSGRVMLGVMFCVFSGEAFGCGMCVTALVDYYLPPIGLWALISAAWFITNGIVADLTGRRLPCQPGFVWSLATTIVLFLLGGVIFGLGALLLLLIPAVIGFAHALFEPPSPDAKGRGATRIAGWIYLSAALYAGGLCLHTHLTRTPEQFICTWGGKSPSLVMFRKLRDKEPASLESYRYLVQHADSPIMEMAADRIGEIGDPAVDLPLLRECLRRARLGEGKQVEAAIARLEKRSGQ